MSYNFNEIKNALIENVKLEFDNSTSPSYNNFDSTLNFHNGLEVFLQTIIYKCGVYELDGLTKTLIPALHEAFITKKGDLAPLKLLASELEPYLKKIAFIISNGTNNFSNDRTKTMIPLLNHLNLNPSSSYLGRSNCLNYKGSNDFLEFICLAYSTRNEVHKSPNWKISEIALNLEAVVITYLYATFKHFTALKAEVGAIQIPAVQNEGNLQPNKNLDLKALYDFISYNNGAIKFKSQIISAYVLHLLSTNGKMTIQTITNACNNHFQTDAHITFYKNLINGLEKNQIPKVLLSGIYKEEVELSEKERARIQKVKEDYDFDEKFLLLEIGQLLKIYGLPNIEQEIVDHLTKLFELYYNIDIAEIHDKGFEAKNNLSNFKDFVDYLKSLTNNEEKAENLFKELILICKSNDILYKVTAGQVFARISNPDYIEQYTRQHERVVYLDANVLLYALCYYYESVEDYNNPSYNSIKDLLDFARSNSNIKLFTTKHYVLETAYQMKEALLLIPFDDAGIFSQVGGSNNLFYNYYKFLEYNNNLEDVESFGEFMEGFELNEEDLYNKNFLHSTSGLIDEMLYTIGIDVIEPPYYNIDDAYEIVKNSLVVAGKFKDEEPMKNDAGLICFLSDKEAQSTEPTFVTLDNSFYDIRKRYLSKNKNSKMWHLFTPSKFLNHLYLIQFKVNSNNITNDYISLIDGLDIYENTKKLLDFTGSIFDINKETKRKYLTKFKEWNAEFVFNINDQVEPSFDSIKLTKPTEKLILELNRYYANEKTEFKFSDLKRLLDKEQYFEQVVNIFEKELNLYTTELNFSRTSFLELDKLIKEMKSVK